MNKNLLIFFFALWVCGCKDIIEPDITNLKLEILAPPDSLHTTISSQTFWWNAVEGASGYNLQIVKPSFISIHQFILDSVIESTQFSITLLPGTYQWRLKAVNSEYSTEFQTRTLFIDSTGDINSQIVVLTEPVNNLITRDQNIIFRWDSIYNADDYRFKLLNSAGTTILDTFVLQNSLSRTLDEDTYTWQVKGENTTGSTAFSSRTLTIDLTAPEPPTSLIPAYEDTVSSTIVSMSWDSDPSSVGDSIYIYSDSLTTLVYSGFITTSTYTFNGTSSHHYYWRLKSVDVADNWGVFSTLFVFFIL
jgi:hypothetical protein